MSSYDHDVLGVGNPDHPANQEELEFDLETLENCLAHYKEYDVVDPLIESIENTITNNASASEIVKLLIRNERSKSEIDNDLIMKLSSVLNLIKT